MKIKFGRGKYEVNMKCSNCNNASLNKIPKGTTIESWIARKGATCEYCGCIIDVKGGSQDEYNEQESTIPSWN